MAGQRHLVMKHRRIVSDTSALHMPMSLMHQQHQSTFISPNTTMLQADPAYQYVILVV